MLDDPAIYGWSDVVALGGRYKLIWRDDLALLVTHTQQQLVMQTGFIAMQWQNYLPENFKTPFFQSIVDTRRPLHLTTPAHQIQIVFLETVDPVTTRFLGSRTGRFSSRNDSSHAIVISCDRHHTDTGAHAESTLLPVELVIAHSFAQ